MRRNALKSVLASVWVLGAAMPACAADQPPVAPVPDWVKPVAYRDVAGGDDQAPVRILASDLQLHFLPGDTRKFVHVALKIGTPEGLSAGNLSFSWSPDTSSLTVHKILIHRGDQVIDVLASGQTFTVVRREQNLDMATLDGVLTANLQPEGLQVGDVVEYFYTLAFHDPVLKGHVEDYSGNWNGLPLARAHFRAIWPAGMPMRWRVAGTLPALKPQRVGSDMVAELTIDDMKPVIPPREAPVRYRIGRVIEMTDYAGWGDISRLMAPLYVTASQLPATGPLHDELEKIRSTPGDAKTRAEAALKLVQDRVRYVALEMGTGGYVPSDATTTWARRFGDCKAKTALLLGLLHAMGIEAVPVAVQTAAGDGMDARLPILHLFDHVLVRATIDGQTYWMDGTRTGRHLLKVTEVPQFGWGLPLTEGTTALVRMMPPPFADPVEVLTVKVDASAGISAPAATEAELLLKGDMGAATNSSLAAMSAEARHEALNRFWKGRLGQVEVTSSATNYDYAAEVLRVTMTGTLRMEWPQNEYRVELADFPFGKIDFSRTPGPDADAPYTVGYPIFRRTVETITLPKDGGAFRIGTDMDLDETIGGYVLHRHAELTNGVFTIEKSERSLGPEFPASEAKSAEARLHALAQKQPLLHMPMAYQSTAGDLAAAKADVPTTAAQYINRAVVYLKKNLTTEALADLNRALELDPSDPFALADRALIKVQLHDYAGARADLARTEAIKPNFAMNFKIRGELALADNNLAVAVPAYEQALALDPDDAFLLSRLSIGEYRLQHYAKALDYFDKLAKLTPEAPGTRYLRMDILEKLGRDADLIPLYTAQIEKAPNSAFLLKKRAAAYLRLGKKDLAAKDTAAADEAARHAPPVVVVPPPVPGRPVVTVPPPQVVVVPPPA